MTDFVYKDLTFILRGTAGEVTNNCGLKQLSNVSLVGPFEDRAHFTEVVNSNEFLDALRRHCGNYSLVMSDRVSEGSLDSYIKYYARYPKQKGGTTGSTIDVMRAIIEGKRRVYTCSPVVDNPTHPGSSAIMLMFLVTNPEYVHSKTVLQNIPDVKPSKFVWNAENKKRLHAAMDTLGVEKDDGRFAVARKAPSNAAGAGATPAAPVPEVQGGAQW